MNLCTYQTVKIFMGPRPTTAVNLPCVPSLVTGHTYHLMSVSILHTPQSQVNGMVLCYLPQSHPFCSKVRSLHDGNTSTMVAHHFEIS
jgi:hypothetical protein